MKKTYKPKLLNYLPVFLYFQSAAFFLLTCLNGVLVYFAACKNHIGFYPTSFGVTAFEKDLVMYQTSKGAIQFPLDKPLPLDLIAEIVKFRMQENLNKQPRKR